MGIKILGPGCENCTKLFELTKKAAAELGIETHIEKVDEIQEIMKYTMNTPAIVVDGKLRHSGKPLPTLEKIKELLKG